MSGGAKGDYVVTFLAALVKVTDGAPVTVSKGDPLPDNAAPGELKRLAALGAIGRRRVADGDGASASEPSAPVVEFDLDSAEVEAVARHLAEGKGGKSFTIPEVLKMAEHDDPATAAKRARLLIAGETLRSGNDPRDGITNGLAKTIEADPTSASAADAGAPPAS